jgi:hypothetical protein
VDVLDPPMDFYNNPLDQPIETRVTAPWSLCLGSQYQSTKRQRKAFRIFVSAFIFLKRVALPMCNPLPSSYQLHVWGPVFTNQIISS